MSNKQLIDKLKQLNPTNQQLFKYPIKQGNYSNSIIMELDNINELSALQGDLGFCDNFNGSIKGSKYTDYIAILQNKSDINEEYLLNITELYHKASSVQAYLSLIKNMMTNSGIDKNSIDYIKQLDNFKYSFYDNKRTFYICGLKHYDFFEHAINKIDDTYFLSYEDINYFLSKNLIPSLYAQLQITENICCYKEIFSLYLQWVVRILIPFFEQLDIDKLSDNEIELLFVKLPKILELDILGYDYINHDFNMYSTYEGKCSFSYLKYRDKIDVFEVKDNSIICNKCDNETIIEFKYPKNTGNQIELVNDYVKNIINILLSNNSNNILLDKIITNKFLFYFIQKDVLQHYNGNNFNDLELIKFITQYYDNITDNDLKLLELIVDIVYNLYSILSHTNNYHKTKISKLTYQNIDIPNFSNDIIRNNVSIDFNQIYFISPFIISTIEQYLDENNDYYDLDIEGISLFKILDNNIFRYLHPEELSINNIIPDKNKLIEVRDFIISYVPISYNHLRSHSGESILQGIAHSVGNVFDVISDIVSIGFNTIDFVLNTFNIPFLLDISNWVQNIVYSGLDDIEDVFIEIISFIYKVFKFVNTLIIKFIACLGTKAYNLGISLINGVEEVVTQIQNIINPPDKNKAHYNFHIPIDNKIPEKIGYYYKDLYLGYSDIQDIFDTLAYDIFYSNKINEDDFPNNVKKYNSDTYKIKLVTSTLGIELEYLFVNVYTLKQYNQDDIILNFIKRYRNDYLFYTTILLTNFYKEMISMTLFAKEDFSEYNKKTPKLKYSVKVYPINILPKVINTTSFFDKIDNKITYKDLRIIDKHIYKYHKLRSIKLFDSSYKKYILDDIRLINGKYYQYCPKEYDDNDNLLCDEKYILLDNSYLIFWNIPTNKNLDIGGNVVYTRWAIKKTYIRYLDYSMEYKIFNNLKPEVQYLLFTKYKSLDIDRDYLNELYYEMCTDHCFQEMLTDLLGDNDVTQFFGNFLDRTFSSETLIEIASSFLTGNPAVVIANTIFVALEVSAEAYDYATDSNFFGDDYFEILDISKELTFLTIGLLQSKSAYKKILFDGGKLLYNKYIENQYKQLNKEVLAIQSKSEYLAYDRRYEPDLYNEVKDYHYNQQTLDNLFNEIGINSKTLNIDKRFKLNSINNHWINKRLKKYNVEDT